MTLKQATKHIEEWLENNKDKDCSDCYKEHKSLLRFLKELKRRREKTNIELNCVSESGIVKGVCSTCKNFIFSYTYIKYCPFCGRKVKNIE